MNYGLERKWPYLSTKNTICEKLTMEDLKIFFKKFLKKNFQINLKKLILLMNID